ncbi:serine/threonine protein kinase [Haematococcus lacustris]|uniref:Serine/threonine protein kinase n=1 Tax=Haematococcus lacustris TaxID=44745 RepID=A0A699YLB8_HAELA|nr:serine/threonine protein kinase [Haematococcus lacustris]
MDILLGLGEVEVLGSSRRVIMLEWMHGGDARTLLDQAMRPMDPQAADSLILPLALALEAAHKAGFVHRDVKAGNALLDHGVGNVRLADWGISVPVEEAASRMSTGGTRERMPGSVGTEFWCAPEIERGLPHGFASDVFSLAITYIELVTGSDPKYDNSIQGVRTLALPSTGFIPDYLPEDDSSTTSASHCPDILPAGTGAGLTSAGDMPGAKVVMAGSLAAGATASDQRHQGCNDQPLLSVFAAVQQPGQPAL